MNGNRASLEQRVLVLAPTGKDAALTSRILSDAHIQCACCNELDDVCRELDLGAAAVLLAEESVGPGRCEGLVQWLAAQPAWSDLPLLVLARAGADSAAVAQAMDQLGNVTVLERPSRITALVSSVRAALRSRQRQYQAREHLTQIARSENDLRDFFDNANVGLHWVGPDGIILRVNQAELEILGYERHEYVGHHISEFHVDAPVIEDILFRLLSGQTVYEREAKIRCKDGSIKYVLISSNALWDNGRFIHSRCFTRDITDRKQAEQALFKSETEARRLLELNQATVANMGEGLYTVDAHGLVTDINPEGQRLFGWNKDELLGRRMHEMTHHSRPDGSPFPIEECSGFQVLHKGVVLKNFEDMFIRRDGTFFPVSYSSSPLRNLQGETVGLVVVFQDISQRKRVEQQLRNQENTQRQLVEAMRDANQRKDEFLATLSHELRTPLTAILGWTQVLEGKTSDPLLMKHGLGIIARNAKVQSELIGDLLDMSRIISGKVRLELADVDLALVVRAAIDSVRQAADAKRLRVETPFNLWSYTVRGDGSRLQQVFWNLLNNAVKFTPEEGKIEVLLTQRSERVVLSVRDTGRGIDAEFLPRVFDRFCQSDSSPSRQNGGLGLGLAIVKQLVDLHGGQVRAESAGPGLGSTFTVDLPLAVGLAETLRPRSAASDRLDPFALPDFSGLRLLAVDDDKDTRAFLKYALEECHAEVLEAGSVDEALLLLARSTPDLLISDIGMPGKDGYALLREIRASGHDTPAIALTAFAGNEDRERAMSSGFQRHIGKPIDLVELISAISTLVTPRYHQEETK